MIERMRKIILFILLIVAMSATAQEFKCTVKVNADQIQGTNKSLFTTLEQSITEYINNNRWTNLTFAEQEKIDCSMMIIVNEVSDGVLNCEMQLQTRRPVYGTSYMTPTMNFRDKNFTFAYEEYDRIEWQQNTFTTNLTAMLAYYCYLMLGIDFDSFQRLGGTPFFEQCEQIVNMAQTASMSGTEGTGWKAFDSNRNRYALINNLLDEAFKKYREYFYEYHRLGLDEMSQNVANARARIAKGMPVLRDANRARPATYVVGTFLDAKSDEIANIFSKGTDEEKKTVYEVLMDIDPTRQDTYEKINER